MKVPSFTFPVLSILLYTSQATAHAIITPALGVSGTPARSDVTRPSNNAPCGNGVNVASAIAGSQSVNAAADGSFSVDVTNFNAGTDGSTQIASTSIDPTGSGQSFSSSQQLTITKNGVKSPTSTGTVQVDATLPQGTTCSGGNDGQSCLVSFTTAGGFGNCVLVSQGSGAAGGAAANSTANGNATGAAGTTTATGNNNASGNGNETGKNRKNQNNSANAQAAGSRLARALKVRKDLGDAFVRQKREAGAWVWAPAA